MIVQLSRFVFTAAGALAGIAVSRLIDWAGEMGVSPELVIIIFIILGAAIGYLLGGIIGRELARLYSHIEESLKDYALTDIVLAAAGLVVGLLVALLVSTPLRLVQDSGWAFLVMVLVYGLCAYAGIQVALLRRHEFGRVFGRLGATASVIALPAKYLDTSAVIDGRFLELERAGFLEGPVRVPTFVLSELHTLADSADELKRARGRLGLDLLASIGGSDEAVEVFEADYPAETSVDSKLVRLAKDSGGAIVTVDANLTKVARVQGARVLNINESAAGMRPAFLPGESMRLVITKEGKEPDQGVGYLEDGTMVVVAGGHEHVGDETEAVVTSVLQTSVGRMVFARLKTT
jgi:uncharacterized protein YacL